MGEKEMNITRYNVGPLLVLLGFVMLVLGWIGSFGPWLGLWLVRLGYLAPFVIGLGLLISCIVFGIWIYQKLMKKMNG